MDINELQNKIEASTYENLCQHSVADKQSFLNYLSDIRAEGNNIFKFDFETGV